MENGVLQLLKILRYRPFDYMALVFLMFIDQILCELRKGGILRYGKY